MKYKAGYTPAHPWKAFLKYLEKIMDSCFGDWSSPPEKRKPVIEKWEYAELYWLARYQDKLNYEEGKPDGIMYRIDGLTKLHGPDDNTRLIKVVELLNELGSQGWEVISVREIVRESVVEFMGSNEVRPNVRTIYTLKREIKHY